MDLKKRMRPWPLQCDANFMPSKEETEGGVQEKSERPKAWKRVPGIVLLGDAAHLPRRSGKEGANMALQDAVELFDCLREEHDPRYNRREDDGADEPWFAAHDPKNNSKKEYSAASIENVTTAYEGRMFLRARNDILSGLAEGYAMSKKWESWKGQRGQKRYVGLGGDDDEDGDGNDGI
ncbi:hypothetical protein F5Y17DRAFT_232935 [Xylariaceae sp. FL0594]|nr:hypothetical protein F5Y17DRAFT_232935 [Xylariaceae sp. FL0594]